MRPQSLNVLQRRRPAARKVVFGLLVVLGLLPGAAHASPGDVTAKRFLKGVATVTTTSPTGVPVFRTPDGGYLAFRETWVTNPKSQTIVERRVLAIRKFSSGGKVDRKFDRSPIGRGIRLARKSEFLDVRKIERQDGDLYLAWATTDGYVFTGERLQWPRTWLVAFNGATGELVRSFGANGVITFGSSGRLYRAKGFSDANALAQMPDGRTVICGQNRFPNLGIHPFVVGSRIDSHRQAPFLSSGMLTFDVFPDEPDLDYQTCLKASAAPNDQLVLGGFAAKDERLERGRAWLTRLTSGGALDPTFGSGGRVVLAPPSPADLAGRVGVSALTVDPAGRTYVVGNSISGTATSFVARLEPNGVVDTSFGNSGYLVTSAMRVRDLWLTPSGEVMISGRTPGYSAAVGRITAAGQWDTSFFGTGQRIYAGVISVGPLRIPGSVGNQVYDWGEFVGSELRQYLVTLE